MNKYKSVLFDLDGTLLDTAKDIMGACNYTLNKFNFESVDEAILRTKITAGMRELLKLGVPQNQWETAGIETVMRDCFANYYREHICDKTTAFDGIAQLIDDLNSKVIKTAVITNKYFDMAKKVLDKFSFSKNFEVILGCDSLKNTKPHPEPLEKTMKALNVQPSSTIYVGDHLNDIKAANAAKTDSVIALWGYGKNECPNIESWGATFKANNVYELKEIIFC